MIEISYLANEVIVDLDENTALILTEDRELVFEDSDDAKVYLNFRSIHDLEALVGGLNKALDTMKKEEREDIFFSKFNDKKFN